MIASLPDLRSLLLARYDMGQAQVATSGDGYQLDGAEMDWEQWLKVYFPHVASKPMAERHILLWEHAESLTPGIKPLPYLAFWGRGGAKSSSLELIKARLCVTLKRRFGLYVCDTQDQADRHVQSVAALLETIGVERSVNKYGSSKGWRRDQLRTANGYNLAGIGLDVASRGIKLDHYRPDHIDLDDIDNLTDSEETVDKKIATLTGSILPAGSVDCAVIMGQNLIHAGSIASKLSKRSAGFLIGATINGPIPAVEGLEYKKHPDTIVGDKIIEGRYHITAGTPTWVGQDIPTCESQINEWGIIPFLRESQHDMRAGTTFFPDYDEAVHVVATPDKGSEFYPLPWWTWYGGLDGGFTDPAGFSLWCHNPFGQDVNVESWEIAQKLPEEVATLILNTLMRWGVDPVRCPITFDQSMRAEKWKGVVSDPDVKKYTDKGLVMRASDPMLDRRSWGWNRVREVQKGKVLINKIHPQRGMRPRLVIYRETAIRTADCMSAARSALRNPEDLMHDATSHVNHANLYSLAGQYGEAIPPKSEEQKAKEARGKWLGLAEYSQSQVRGQDYV